jgi:hypothetical protein
LFLEDFFLVVGGFSEKSLRADIVTLRECEAGSISPGKKVTDG